ncbi:MAG: tetratricopeptide repeat protein [Verrucomicrobiae bacterium]|nr:tetratricopeptide repeat protein [Verrucomicrobiae bacterium]
MSEPEEQQIEPHLDLWIQLQTWAETRRKQIGIGSAVLLAGAFAIYTNTHLQASKQRDAEAALFALNKLPAPGEDPKPVAAGEYLKVAGDYAGTRTAERALMLGAGALFTENKYPEAEKRFAEFIAAYPASPLVRQARLGIAACKDAQGSTEEALAAYEQLIASGAGTGEGNQAKLAASLIYDAKGEADKALKYYDELLRANPPVIWRQEAGMRREDLLKRHPQLTPSGNTQTAALPTPLLVSTNAPKSTNSVATTNSAPITNTPAATKQ